MKITENRLRRIIEKVILESAGSGPQLGKGYGCEVYGENIDFDSFALRIILDNEFNVKYAKQAVEMQEGQLVGDSTGNILLAKFPHTTRSGDHQSPKLVAENIAFYVGRG